MTRFYIMPAGNTSAVIGVMPNPQMPSGLAMPTDGPPLSALPEERAVRTIRSLPTLRTIAALMLREMSTSYGRSPGGYFWALIEPVGAIALLSTAFALLMRHPPLGTNFVLFYATGFLPFSLFLSISASVARSINYSRPLLSYPAVTWMDALAARLILNALTGMMVGYIVLTGIMLLFDTGAVIRIGPILVSLAMAILLGLGVGSVNCVLFGLVPVWGQIWAILTRPLMLLSGVIILQESLPRWVRDLLWYNPLSHVTAEMRRGFYPMYDASFVSLTYVFGLALGLTVLGLMLLGRYHLDILNDD